MKPCQFTSGNIDSLYSIVKPKSHLPCKVPTLCTALTLLFSRIPLTWLQAIKRY